MSNNGTAAAGSGAIDESFVNEMEGMVIPKKVFEELRSQYSDLSRDEMIIHLAHTAQTMAYSPVTQKQVGAAGIGKSGKVYLGFNVEFPETTIVNTLHAEQAVISLVVNNDDKLTFLAVTSQCCGLCLQLLSELPGSDVLKLSIPYSNNGTLERMDGSLKTFLPYTFAQPVSRPTYMPGNPESLWIASDALAHPVYGPCRQAAFEAAQRSYKYTPFTQFPAGIALKGHDNKVIYSGSYIESGSFNASILPFQSALIDFASKHYKRGVETCIENEKKLQTLFNSLVTHVTLIEFAEAPFKHQIHVVQILQKWAPNVTFEAVGIEKVRGS